MCDTKYWYTTTATATMSTAPVQEQQSKKFSKECDVLLARIEALKVEMDKSPDPPTAESMVKVNTLRKDVGDAVQTFTTEMERRHKAQEKAAFEHNDAEFKVWEAGAAAILQAVKKEQGLGQIETVRSLLARYGTASRIMSWYACKTQQTRYQANCILLSSEPEEIKAMAARYLMADEADADATM